MGADVMMGHDPDCARWIRAFREAPPAAAPGRAARRRAGAARAAPPARPKVDRAAWLQDRWWSSRLRASAGALPWARRCCRRRARSAWTSIRCAAAAALCGRCQVLVMEGEFAKHGVHSTAQNLSPLSAPRSSYFSQRASCAAGRSAVLLGARTGRCRRRCARSSQVHRQVVRKEADARDIELDPGGAAA